MKTKELRLSDCSTLTWRNVALSLNNVQCVFMLIKENISQWKDVAQCGFNIDVQTENCQ